MGQYHFVINQQTFDNLEQLLLGQGLDVQIEGPVDLGHLREAWGVDCKPCDFRLVKRLSCGRGRNRIMILAEFEERYNCVTLLITWRSESQRNIRKNLVREVVAILRSHGAIPFEWTLDNNVKMPPEPR